MMSGQASGASVSINGNRQQANQYLLDGMNVNQTLDDTQGYVPNVDAIAQVQVISANANAEYGNVNGGDILYQTKSGTNNWHGSAFYFLNNYNLDANSWLNNRNGVAKNSYTRNLFGGTFGGPVIKDKLFFFVAYQGGRYHLGGTQSASVFTPRMRQGDFSELLNPAIMGAGRTIQLYNSTQRRSSRLRQQPDSGHQPRCTVPLCPSGALSTSERHANGRFANPEQLPWSPEAA